MASTTKWVLVHTVNVLLMMIDPNGIMITLMTIDNEICDDDDVDGNAYMTQLLLLGKFEYTRGPIFKVVLEC